MGADTKLLRSRIKSVSSTLHLTAAMGLVASSKIRRAIDAMLKGKDYAEALEETVSLLSGFRECQKSPYMKKAPSKRNWLLAIAGDRGLAGGYNANLFRLVASTEHQRILPVGKRACERFGAPLISAENFSYENALDFAKTICQGFLAGELDRFGIAYTKYHSMMSQEATIRWILPLEQKSENSGSCAIFEPDEKTVLDTLVPDYVAGMILSSVRESFASEVAARRVAMDSAEKNAREMIEELELEYNRARQGAITQEITEIVAGGGEAGAER